MTTSGVGPCETTDTGREMPQRRRRRVRITRDLVLFVVGVAGIVWQTVAESVDRPYLLAVFTACVGLPTYLASTVKEPADDGDRPR